MNDTLTTLTFSATAATERTIKSHWLNASTYALIAAVLILTALKAVFTFLIEQVERLPEYELRAKLAKVSAQRQAISAAIAVASFVAYNGIDRRIASVPSLTVRAIDAAFCLG